MANGGGGGGGQWNNDTVYTRRVQIITRISYIEDGHFIVILCYALLKIPHFVAILVSMSKYKQFTGARLLYKLRIGPADLYKLEDLQT